MSEPHALEHHQESGIEYATRLRVLTAMVIGTIILLFVSVWILEDQGESNKDRLDSLEAGLAALSVAIDEVRAEQPDVSIPSPEEIIEEAGENPADLLPRPGPPGAQGEQGIQGEQGPQGPAGPRGEDGADGASIVGATGATGSTGPAGVDGATGPAGPPGPVGAEGPAGAAGPQGPAGPSGPGPTAEQIAEAVADFCAANDGCVGPAGPAGPEGPAGPQGPEGPAGPAGPQGPPGDSLTGIEIAALLCEAGWPQFC